MGAVADTELAIFQLKISLVGTSKPSVWRRLLVPADLRLDQLHDQHVGIVA